MRNRVQFSLDDVKGFLKFLTGNSDVKSIFDTIALNFLRELHRTYGTEFTLFCMCKSKDFTLEQVPDCYREEFQQNQDWLHFGFHALDESSDYGEATQEQVLADYRITMGQISRITGITCFSDTIRLHAFAGSREACRALKTQGIRCLLTADDERYSYYLDPKECEQINSAGMYYEESEGILFCRSLVRLENSKTPVDEIKKALDNHWEKIAVFTHEWQMDKEDVRQKLRECCDFISQI